VDPVIPNFGTDQNHDIFSTPYHGTLVTNPDWRFPRSIPRAEVAPMQARAGIAIPARATD